MGRSPVASRSFLVLTCALSALSVLSACGGGGGGGSGVGSGVPATASVSRGALLYDEWWTVTGGSEPATTQPAYPKPPGTQSGSTTWRCAECHGWDYEGAAGAAGVGSSHYTGIAGLLSSASLAPQALFDAVQAVGTTHDFTPVLTTDDAWDLVAFVKSGLVDMSGAIDTGTGMATGVSAAGSPLFAAHCASCHGANGETLDLGGGHGVGARADADPWQVLHRIRWGTPGTAMPSMVAAGLTATEQANLLAFCQTLPGTPPPPPPPPPATLSYATDIKPIWTARSCTGCHGTSGGLTLSGTTAASYAELFETTARIDLATPTNSLILRKPSTTGVSHGGGKIFSSTSDADYVKILTWIQQGALNN